MLPILLAVALTASSPSDTFPVSTASYCENLNAFATDIVGVDTSEPLIYHTALFEGSLALANDMDPSKTPTPEQITKAAQDSQDCYPSK